MTGALGRGCSSHLHFMSETMSCQQACTKISIMEESLHGLECASLRSSQRAGSGWR